MQEKSRILIRSGEAFADALATARRTSGMTQATMAERLRCSRDTITNLESGRSRQLERLARFVRFCGYDIVLVPRESAAPNTLSPNTISPETLSPNTLSPETLSPNTLSSKTVSPKTVSPKTVSPKTVSPKTVPDSHQQ